MAKKKRKAADQSWRKTSSGHTVRISVSEPWQIEIIKRYFVQDGNEQRAIDELDKLIPGQPRLALSSVLRAAAQKDAEERAKAIAARTTAGDNKTQAIVFGNSDLPKPIEEKVKHDGPEEPDFYWYGGKRHTLNLQAKQFRLLKVLCSKGDAVEIADISKEVFDDRTLTYSRWKSQLFRGKHRPRPKRDTVVLEQNTAERLSH